MRIAGLIAFIPQEFIVLLVVCGGMLIMVGARKLAGTLFTLSAVLVLAPVVLDPLLAELPDWALYLLLAYAVADVLAMFMVLLIGERAWDGTKGQLAAQVITFFFLAPFRLLGLMLFGRARR